MAGKGDDRSVPSVLTLLNVAISMRTVRMLLETDAMGKGDSDPEKWDYPPHTKAKHDMLASYLDGWFPILSSWNGRVLFFDGFAGRGRYTDGSEGSPLVALRRLVEHRSFPRMRDREFVFFLVEANEDNAESLDREIEAFKAEKAPWPAGRTRRSAAGKVAAELVCHPSSAGVAVPRRGDGRNKITDRCNKDRRCSRRACWPVARSRSRAGTMAASAT
jgi:hypothetical protein